MKAKLFVLSCILCLSACNSVDDELIIDETPVSYSFTAKISDGPDTRVSYTYDDTNNKLKCTWEKGDQIKLTSSADGSEFLFKATTVSGGVATFTYQGTSPIHNADDFSGTAEFVTPNKSGYSAQRQIANNSTDHIKYGENMSATLSDVDLTNGSTQISLQHQQTIYKVTIPAPKKIAYNSTVLIKGIRDSNNEEMEFSVQLNWGSSKVAAIQQGSNIVVYIVGEPGYLNSGDKLRIIIKQSQSIESVRGDEYYYVKTANYKTNFINGKLYNLTTTKSEPDYTAVDLGLRSGTKWATFNIGATSTEDCGNFFRWGEAEAGVHRPIYSNPFTTSNWSSITYASLSTLENTYKFPKGDFQGVVTTISGKKYGDAATANWTSEWKVPTEDQWEELNCGYWVKQGYDGYWDKRVTSTPETLNGVNGLRITSTQYPEKSIFIPVSGYYHSSSPSAGTSLDNGYYWSSTRCEPLSVNDTDNYDSWYMEVWMSDSNTNPTYLQLGGISYGRYEGKVIRPIIK